MSMAGERSGGSPTVGGTDSYDWWARWFYNQGAFGVVPASRSSKRPLVESWGKWQKERMREEDLDNHIRERPPDSAPAVIPGGSTIACWDCDCEHATKMMRALGLTDLTLCENRPENPARLHVWFRGSAKMRNKALACHVCQNEKALDLRGGPEYTIVPGGGRSKVAESPISLVEMSESDVAKMQRMFSCSTRIAATVAEWGWRHGRSACHQYSLGLACVFYFAGVEREVARRLGTLVLRYLGDEEERSKDTDTTFDRAEAGQEVSRYGIEEAQRDQVRVIVRSAGFSKAAPPAEKKPREAAPEAAPPAGERPPPTEAPVAGPSRLYEKSDLGNSQFFADHYCDRIRYDHTRERWFVWSGHWWMEDPAGIVVEYAKDAIQLRLDKANEDDYKESLWCKRSQSRGHIEAMMGLARSDPRIAVVGTDWNRDPWMLGVENGVVDLRTGELLPGKREDKITLHCEVVYDPAAKAPRWEQFVREVFRNDEGLISFVHRALGYSISGQTSEEVWFLCWGQGANGKSTLLRTLREMMGGYGYNVPFTTFEVSPSQQIPADIAGMAGKRFVTAVESAEGHRLNEARVKNLTGADPVTARFLYGNFFEFLPNHKLWLATNHRPRVHDDSLAFWRRVRLIPFNAMFQGAAEEKGLHERLKSESAGILNWLIAGCAAWRKDGLDPPSAVIAATKEYREDSDPLAEFVEERCALEGEIGATALMQAYRDWCDERKMPDKERLSTTSFGRRMSERFPRKHTSKGRVYQGIRLKEQSTLHDSERKPTNATLDDARLTAQEHAAIIKSLVAGFDTPQGPGAKREDVAAEALKRGIDTARFDYLMQQLMENGRIYESEIGRWKVT